MPKHQFESTFIGRESRKSKYTKWSERAVVVGYNSESKSYDIVVTTERLVGSNKRSLNRTIRKVKSTFPADVDTFLPGTAVLVGYVSDKREHPVILGQGDNAVQTPAKVTLGPTLQIETNEPTPLNPAPLFPTPCTGFLTDSITGSTTTLVIDCDTLDITGCFRAEVEAPSGCGCGVYDWSISSPGGTGFTISDQGALATAIGATTTLAPLNAAGTQLKICPPTNSGGFSGILAYTYVGAIRAPANCDCSAPGVCGTICGFVTWECDDTKLGVGGSTPFCDCVAKCPPGPSGSNKCSVLPGVCQGAVPPNPPGDCGLPVCGSPFELANLQDLIEAGRVGELADCRTSAMLSGGCHPCNLTMPHSILTAEDACGKMTSIELVKKGTIGIDGNPI